MPVAYFRHPSLASLLPSSGPTDGGTVVLLVGSGLAAFSSPTGRGLCRFGLRESPLTVLNDTHALCTSTPAPPAGDDDGTPATGETTVQVALNGQPLLSVAVCDCL